MSNITYLIGDATNPIKSDDKKNIIIPHICNTLGLWGAGFVLALSKKWKQPELAYKIKNKNDYLTLGDVDFVRVENNIIIANMIAQKGIKSPINLIPIKYDALKKCLLNVNDMALETNSNIHMPKIGSGLAGGDWNVIENIIKDTLSIDVYIYEFKS